MPTPLASGTFEFADGNAGHSCNLGSAPNAGEWDILCVNSDTTVSTPSGFTVAPSDVNSQGVYVFRRKAAGGEASTVTVTTTGNFNAKVAWSRWPTSLVAADKAAITAATATPDTQSPAHSTGTLTEATELVIAFCALHSIGVADQNTPVWSTGYTALTGGPAQGTAGTGVRSFVGYKSGAGTAADTPSVSWSGASVGDRTMATLTFTVSGGSTVSGTLAAALGALTGVLTGIRTGHGTFAAPLGALTGALAGTRVGNGVLAAPLGGVTATLAGTITRHGRLAADLGALSGVLTGDHPPVTVVDTGSWYTLLDIVRENRAEAAAERSRPFVACPIDGEPLKSGPHGELYCPFDGWRPDGLMSRPGGWF